MFINNIIWIKIKSNSYYNTILKLNNLGINVLDIKNKKEYILIKTFLNDYNKIKKYLKSYKVTIYSSSGFNKLKEIFRKYLFFIISIIISVIILIICNFYSFKVEIKSNNKKIKELINNELVDHDLGVLKPKKNHKEIEIIVKDILNKNKDALEWLEIKYNGLVMIVNVTEKTINKKNIEKNYCNIIAKTDAKIISMNLLQGVALKEINDYVNKDDIIVSGDIIHNEEVKNRVCANGEIFGEVWYKVNVKMPLKVFKKEYTRKNRYNVYMTINDKKYNIFKSRINGLKDEEINNLYTLNNFKIDLVKEKEYITKEYLLSEDEALEEAIKSATDKINNKLMKNEEILIQKVLKKSINNSTIELDMFIVVKENIGVLEEIEGDALKNESSN